MIKNKDFTGSLNINPFYFSHFNCNHFTLFCNGRPLPSEGLALDLSHEETTVLAYNTLFEGSGIRNSNAGLQVTHSIFIEGYFILLFDLTKDRAASEDHISFPDQGNIRLELRFDKPLSEVIACLLYLEYDNCVRIDQLRTVSADSNNGHGGDTLHAKGRAIISRHVYLRHSASFDNMLRDSYRKYRSTHC